MKPLYNLLMTLFVIVAILGFVSFVIFCPIGKIDWLNYDNVNRDVNRHHIITFFKK